MTSRCDCGETGEPRDAHGTRDVDGAETCPRCGGRRAQISGADALLAKLSQLARFGLAAEDGPLLESSYEGR